MKIILTNDNLNYILGLLNKKNKGNGLTSQLFYPSNEKLHNFCNSLGLNKHIIRKSNKHVFFDCVIELGSSIYQSEKYIRVHNNVNSLDWSIDNDNYKAFIFVH